MSEQPTCGRCGVYQHLHPTRSGCVKPRHSWWWDRHHLWRHAAAGLWLALSDRQRMNIVSRLHDRRPRLCWCEFVDAALIDNKRDDYRGTNGCLCDVPLPFNIGLPRVGWCYCPPTNLADPGDVATEETA